MELNIAILDLYDGEANEGMRCIRQIISEWGKENDLNLSVKEFDVRKKLQVPDTSFDIYISSGGPGSPLESEGSEWEEKYFAWVHNIEEWNNNVLKYPKKQVFFICHSYQLITRYYEVANVCKRNSTAFGVFPVHMLEDGPAEKTFEGLTDPFYAVDSREYQVIEPDYDKIHEMGGRVLAIEKERPHVPFERAIMAIRFNEYFIGTQFHPEADGEGMSMYLQREDKKKTVIDNHGEEKWKSMIEQLNDPDKIRLTYQHVLPNFLRLASGQLKTTHY
ncbi:MAG: synthase [Chitinophagaceae bacterium]|nr:synthase [Chitinophagaceae bacterium]